MWRAIVGISIDPVSPVVPKSCTHKNRYSEMNHLPEQHSLLTILRTRKQILFRDVVHNSMEVWRSTDPYNVVVCQWTHALTLPPLKLGKEYRGY